MARTGRTSAPGQHLQALPPVRVSQASCATPALRSVVANRTSLNQVRPTAKPQQDLERSPTAKPQYANLADMMKGQATVGAPLSMKHIDSQIGPGTAVGKTTRRPSILGNEADDTVLGVEFFDGEEMETYEKGGQRHEDLILKSGSTYLRVNVDFVPPGFAAPLAECPCRMEYPMAVMRGSNVKQLEQLVSNEEARASGLLLDLNFCSRVVSRTEIANPNVRVQKTILLPMSGQRVLNPLRRIIYLAHHWQGAALPDNSAGSKLRLIKSYLNEEDFAWLDIWSLPCPFRSNAISPGALCSLNAIRAAAPKALDVQAMRSMQAYVFHASQLLFVAPSREDFEQLLGSVWCQAELLAAMCPVVRRETVTSAGSSWSLCTRVLRHACQADGLLGNSRDQWHGGEEIELIPLDPTFLRDPLACKVINSDDLPILQHTFDTVRETLRAAKPHEEATYEVAISGIKESVIDGMLRILARSERAPEKPLSLRPA